MAVVTEIPEELRFRGIAPPEPAHGFRITLDTAEPWGGGHIEGRVERRGERHDRRSISVRVRCLAAWLDVAPQLLGRKRLLSWTTYGDIRNRAVPIWLDEEVFADGRRAGATRARPTGSTSPSSCPGSFHAPWRGPSSRSAGSSRRAAHGSSAAMSRRSHFSSKSRRRCPSFASRLARSGHGGFWSGGPSPMSAAPQGPAR